MASSSAVLTSSTVSTTPTTSFGLNDEEAKRRVENIERCRQRTRTVGTVQLIWGIIGMCISFNWVSNILTLAVGCVAFNAWRTLTDSLRYFDRHQIGCCDPGHTKGLCIAIIVFSILELISFGAVWPIGAFYIALANIKSDDGSSESSYAIPLGARSLITWIGLCIVAAVVWAAVNLILAIVQMCFTDALLAAGGNRIIATSSMTPQVTVVAVQPQGGMQMSNGHQPMMMMVPNMQQQQYPYYNTNGAPSNGYPYPQQQQQQQQQQPEPVSFYTTASGVAK